MSNAEYFKARTAAGRAAVCVADDHEHDVAAATIRGLMAGFLCAAAEVEGWDAVLAHVRQLATAARVPAEPEKFSPRVLQGGRAE